MRSVALTRRLCEVFGVGSYDANVGAGYGRTAVARGPGKTWQQDALYPYRTDSETTDDVDDGQCSDDGPTDELVVKTGQGHLTTNRLSNRIRDLGSFVDGSSRLDLAHLIRMVVEDNFYTVGSRSSGMQSKVSGTTRGWSAPVGPLPWDEAVVDHESGSDRVWDLEDVAAETELPRQLQRQKRASFRRD